MNIKTKYVCKLYMVSEDASYKAHFMLALEEWKNLKMQSQNCMKEYHRGRRLGVIGRNVIDMIVVVDKAK